MTLYTWPLYTGLVPLQGGVHTVHTVHTVLVFKVKFFCSLRTFICAGFSWMCCLLRSALSSAPLKYLNNCWRSGSRFCVQGIRAFPSVFFTLRWSSSVAAPCLTSTLTEGKCLCLVLIVAVRTLDWLDKLRGRRRLGSVSSKLPEPLRENSLTKLRFAWSSVFLLLLWFTGCVRAQTLWGQSCLNRQ